MNEECLKVIQDYTQSLATVDENIQSISTLNSKDDATLESLKNQIEDKNKLLQEYHQQKLTYADEKKVAWSAHQTAQDQLNKIKNDYKANQNRYQRMIPAEIRQGMESIDKYVQENHIEGVYGSVLSLIHPKKELYCLPLDIVGGTSLFHYVVRDDALAVQLVEYLHRINGGRLTFLPLNRLQASSYHYPTTDEAIPLIQTIQYDPQYENV